MSDAETHYPVLVIADNEGRAAKAARAIDIVRSGALQRIRWAAAVAALTSEDHRSIIMIEARGVPDEMLEAVLPAIVAAADRGAQIVAAFDAAQIDIVTAHLLDIRAQLLCDADIAERVAALMIAIGKRERVAPSGLLREDEAERLARLDAEVARIAEVLARLTRRDEEPKPVGRDDVADRRTNFDSGPAQSVPIEAADIRRAIRARRLRDAFLGEGLFEDPGWDMLLDLFAAHLERTQVSVSSLCIASAVAPTTALRWIGRLNDARLVQRAPDPVDRRRAFMALSQRGLDAMRRYVIATRNMAAPIA